MTQPKESAVELAERAAHALYNERAFAIPKRNDMESLLAKEIATLIRAAFAEVEADNAAFIADESPNHQATNPSECVCELGCTMCELLKKPHPGQRILSELTTAHAEIERLRKVGRAISEAYGDDAEISDRHELDAAIGLLRLALLSGASE